MTPKPVVIEPGSTPRIRTVSDSNVGGVEPGERCVSCEGRRQKAEVVLVARSSDLLASDFSLARRSAVHPYPLLPSAFCLLTYSKWTLVGRSSSLLPADFSTQLGSA